MNEQLEKAREWLEDISLHPTRTGDTQHAEALLAAMELVPGDLGEAMEFLATLVADAEHIAGVDRKAAAIRKVCQALREARAALALAATELVVQTDITTTSGCLPEQQAEQPEAVSDPRDSAVARCLLQAPSTCVSRIVVAEQPEADPELVDTWRRISRETAGLLYVRLQLGHAEEKVAAIRQVLQERGETDGNDA